MSTLHECRLIIVLASDRRGPFRQWLKAERDAAGDNWLTTEIRPAGGGDVSHYMCDTAETWADIKKLLRRLCQQLHLEEPSEWDGWTWAQKWDWVSSNVNSGFSTHGIYVQACHNDGDWSDHDPDGLLATLGLEHVTTEMP